MKSLAPLSHQCQHNHFEKRQLPDPVESVFSPFQHTEAIELNPLDGSSDDDVFASAT